ncbi:MAG: hypothetical protein CSA18_03285 [Deltaproteobacteria bacterium]|nr:MAG: hypothetical protein CSA18_03285 [Deltaproteobacteria bacterium]
MPANYFFYRFIITFVAEFLIKAAQIADIFIKNKFSDFFLKRSGRKIISSQTSSKKIWFFASSVGEASVCEILINQLTKSKKNLAFHVSIMTDSGLETAKKNLSHIADLSYSPIDSVFSIRKALDSIQPDILCLIETEIWPNLICETGKKNIPILILNARISNKTISSYMKIKHLLNHVFKYIKEFNAASELDKNNLLKLGVDRKKIQVSGNAKYDFEIKQEVISKTKNIYMDIFGFKKNDKILVCGSTRSGEEEIIIKAFLNLKKQIKSLKLILVPRHLQRIEEITKIFNELGCDFSLRTELKNKQDAVLCNTMGELKNIYTIADLVFIGGSMKNFGGQNLLEPASLSKPLIFGKYMEHFKEISELIKNNKGGFEVNESNFEKTALSLLKNNDFAKTTGQNAFFAMSENKGAAKGQISTIIKYLDF